MERIAPSVYASTGFPGVNVGFIVVPAGAVAVDAPTLPADAHAWREQIVETARGPILYVVLTDAHPDRVLSAALLGAPVVAARAAYERAALYTEGFWRGAIEGWLRRYPKSVDDLADVRVALPEVMFTQSVTLHKGGTDVTVTRVAGGAPGSAWIYLREQDVLFAGDTVVVETHPYMDATPDSRAWLDTLKSLRRNRFSETLIIPGRGGVCNQSGTRPLSEYIALARRRARSLLRGGRVRIDRAAATVELLSRFPVPDGEHDAVQRRIRASLDRLCDEAQGI